MKTYFGYLGLGLLFLAGLLFSTTRALAEVPSSAESASSLPATTESSDAVQPTGAQTNAVEVSSWQEFVSAYNNKNVANIKVTNDIRNDNRTFIKARATSIDIDGGNHVFDMQYASLGIVPFNTGPQTFSVHDVSKVISKQATVQGFISNGLDWAMGNSGWTINVANVSSDPGMRTRLVTSLGSQLNLSGNITWYTASEMAQVSGVRITDNANVTSFKANSPEDRSFFWFADTTGLGVGSREFVVGKNAKANFRMTGSGVTYPVVFAYYDRIHLEEGATYNATMPGNAFRADWGKGSDFIADGDNKINLTSLSKGKAPVYFNGIDPQKQNVFKVGPNSELYIIAATNTSLFQTGIADNKNRQVTIDSPKILDLKNYSTGQSSLIAGIAPDNLGLFKITNAEISLWNLSSNVDQGPDYTSPTVSYVEQNRGVVSSDDQTLEGMFKTTRQRRISSLSQKPTTEWNSITDADKKITARVKIGEVPDDNGMDESGNIHYTPVYASKGEAMVEITDTRGNQHRTIPTDENGYASYAADDFQQAGKMLSSSATRGSWAQDAPVETTVIDITPPDPARIIGSLNPGSSTLSGTGEAGSEVTLTVNDQPAGVKGRVDAQGNFAIDISQLSLKENDIVQIFLQDHSGKALIADRPATNNDVGNIEPKEDLTFHDRVFEAATQVKVQGGTLAFEVPAALNFGQNIKLSPDMLNLKGVPTGTLTVSDTRAASQKSDWQLSLRETKPLLGNGATLEYINRAGQVIAINDQNQPIERHQAGDPEEAPLSADWQAADHGLFLKIPPETQKVGDYSGTLIWTLSDKPAAN